MKTKILKPEPISYGQRFLMTFIMLSVIRKNIPQIVVLLAENNIKTSDLIKICNLQKTLGDLLVTAPPVNDTTMHAQAASLETINNQFKAVPPTAQSSQVTIARSICITSYNKVAAYIQGIARDAAIASGNVAAGVQVVLRCGYRIKKVSSRSPKHFKVTPVGVGAVNISTKAVGKRASYIRQYGPTTTKGVGPTVIAETLISVESDVYLNGLKSGTIYAFREATVLAVKRTANSGTVTNLTEKTATPSVSTKAHRVTFTDGAEHYVWSDWVYVVIL